MKPTDKRQQSPSKENTNQQEPPAGAHGKRETDSQGDQGGDKTGGGEEGAGQRAPREGTGSDGQNQSADKGAGESAEQGKDNTSPNAGQDAKGKPQAGSGGSEKGQGDKRLDGTGDKAGGSTGAEDGPARDGRHANEKREQAGDAEQDKETGRQGDKEPSQRPDQQGQQSGKGNDRGNEPSPGGASGGGGQPGGAIDPQPSITGSAPEGDEANLEYARKQTDLVLEKLSDQLKRNKVDDKLLKELGWTKEDLNRFISRWQQRKEAAQRDDPSGEAAKRELDDALRSLGLRRGAMKQSAVKDDTMRDLKQGYRGPVPLEYQERLRAYNQGVSRARGDDK
jgi:hypothetical protein